MADLPESKGMISSKPDAPGSESADASPADVMVAPTPAPPIPANGKEGGLTGQASSFPTQGQLGFTITSGPRIFTVQANLPYPAGPTAPYVASLAETNAADNTPHSVTFVW